LTYGELQVKDIIAVREHFKMEESYDDKEEKLMGLLYLSESGSEHPIGKAIVKKIE